MPYLTLPSKPSAPIAYDLFSRIVATTDRKLLIVFINGLGLPAASWLPAVKAAIAQDVTYPMLTYDRFGQGLTSSRDPADQKAGKEPGYGHDLLDVVGDLHELVQVVSDGELELEDAISAGSLQLVLVAASIGAHVARLYAHLYPGTVTALLILDSNIGNKEYSDLWPDPHAPNFDPKQVIAEDCTLEQYVEATDKLARMFNSDVKNMEGLDRRNVKTLLPEAKSPKLKGADGKGPWITIVGHDPEAFANEGLRFMGTPRSLTMKFTNPAWKQYNEELPHITDEDRRRGVVIATHCGHFIQKDDPEFVAMELKQLLEKVM